MPTVAASQGRPCRMWLELEPAVGQVVPEGFAYYLEWLGPDGEPEFVLKSRENGEQAREGNKVYLDIDVPPDAPVGLYEPTRLEIRYGAGNHRRVREESIDDVALPSIDVSEGGHPEIAWPKIKASG